MDQYYHQYNTIHTLEYIGRMVHVYKIAIMKVISNGCNRRHVKLLIGSTFHQYHTIHTLNITWIKSRNEYIIIPATIYVNYFWSVHDICDNQGVYPIEYIEADNVFRFYD